MTDKTVRVLASAELMEASPRFPANFEIVATEAWDDPWGNGVRYVVLDVRGDWIPADVADGAWVMPVFRRDEDGAVRVIEVRVDDPPAWRAASPTPEEER